MISGTPILVYAPQETAVSRFCHKNECAMCVNDHSEDAVAQAITYLIHNEAYRRELSRKAVKLATELFDAGIVRGKLYNVLIKLTESEKSGIVG
jgi:glycosyltransferase involved in cell wall biosynthesis